MLEANSLSGDNPSCSNRAGADQSSDSPTGGLIACRGSIHTTLSPALARCSEAAFPAKPPPMTVTSQEVDVSRSCMLEFIESGSVAEWCVIQCFKYLLDLPEMAPL